ncbi:MAG TPA: FtsX-like permease family protein, partial [Bacteroidota bacterium]|nr:FtsX-like permease family protein [Bacteroidota bacterium]
PNSAVLTRDLAIKLFGTTSPIGKTLLIDEEKRNRYGVYQNLFTVTGVVENPPANSHIQFSMITSMASYPEVAWFNWSWVWMQVVTYVKLNDGSSAASVEQQIPTLVKKYGAAGFSRVGIPYDDLLKGGGRWNFVLQPMTDVYLGSVTIGNRLGPLGNRMQLYLFSIVAFFMLAIACTNFTNITTARSVSRVKEIGVRKVLGSARTHLVGQFLLESITTSLLATPVALLLVEVALTPFNHLSGKSLSFHLFEPAWMPIALLLLSIVVGVVSGSYPGIYLSSLRPAVTVRGSSALPAGGRKLRDLLVVAQFAITIGLIACTILVKQQLDFVRQSDLGFDRRNVVVISNENNRLSGKSDAFRNALVDHPGVLDASVSNGVPPLSGFQDYYTVEGKADQKFELTSYLVDDHFIHTMGITLLSGRPFSKEYNDSACVILNEAAVRLFGLSDPLGSTIAYPGGDGTKFKVVGVMKDFNFWSVYSPISPFALFHSSSRSYTIPASYVVVRVRQEDLHGTLGMLEATWKTFAPATPFEYTFLDESLESQYRSAEQLGEVFFVFSALTIIVACVGLFGLAVFATERRTKEIGIRKVLGASEREVVGLLSKDFVRLVLAANLVAIPVSWYVMNRWLQDFAYRIEIGWTIFAIAGLIALLIAMVTVSAQAIKAALSNPVEALRYE